MPYKALQQGGDTDPQLLGGSQHIYFLCIEPCFLQENHQRTELASALQGQLSTVKASLIDKDKAHRDERAMLLRRAEDLEGQIGNMKVRPSILFKS